MYQTVAIFCRGAYDKKDLCSALYIIIIDIIIMLKTFTLTTTPRRVTTNFILGRQTIFFATKHVYHVYPSTTATTTSTANIDQHILLKPW